MSPSEFDLRAALRDGESDGDGIDVDGIVAHGRARSARTAQLRVRALSTAAAVLVVGTGAVVLRGSTNSPSASSAADGQAAASSVRAGHADSAGGNQLLPKESRKAAAPAPAGRASAGSAPDATPAPACPTVRPRPLVPRDRGSAGAAMFAQPVSTIVVCSYGSPLTPASGQAPGRLVLTGSAATALADSIERASTRNLVAPCPLASTTQRRDLVLTPVSTDGATLATVTTTLSNPPCNVQVTNGQAVRYSWAPPPSVVTALFALTPTTTRASVQPTHARRTASPPHN